MRRIWKDGNLEDRPLYMLYISSNRGVIVAGSGPLGVVRDEELPPPSL